MNFIIYDLEATCWRGRPPGEISEIIEIGAVRLDRYGEVTGTFNQFIKPVVNPLLSPFCTQLTSIQQEDVDRAEKFPDVLELFKEWSGIYEDEYLMASWGEFDKEIIISNCELHDLEYEWVETHINLRKAYRRLKKLSKPVGLKKAVRVEGFEFTGIHHRGISDAENLAKIFAKYVDEWEV
jgi:inhibitor of KinA sporulation pathway (predicted exonuclease)